MMSARSWLGALAAMVGVFPVVTAAPDDGATLGAVEIRGDGPVDMVLVPGFGCDWSVWEHFMARNADRYTMHAVTLAGVAGAGEPAPEQPAPANDAEGADDADQAAEPPAPGATPLLDEAVAAIARHIEEAGLENPVVVGHSMGALVAMRVGIEHPGSVGKVVAVDGFAAFPLAPESVPLDIRIAWAEQQLAPGLRQMSDEQWRSDQAQMAETLVSNQERARELRDMFEKTPRTTAARYLIEMFKSDITSRIPQLRAPLLAVAALDADPAGHAVVRQIWRSQLEPAPDERIIFFENVPHFVMDEAPEAFDAALAAFIAGEPVGDYRAPAQQAAPAPPAERAPEEAPQE